jgi:hypothetical protein
MTGKRYEGGGMTDKLTALVQKFEEAEQSSHEARTESERCRDYYDGRQLTDTEIKALKDRRQPIVIENLIRPKIDYLCGLERQTRTDPRAWPRTQAHEADAEAATDALRYVADDQSIDIKRSAVFQNMLIEGYGGVEVGHAKTGQGLDPAVTHISWDRLFYDPHSALPDFTDARYLGYITWMDASEAKARWQGAEKVIDQTVNKPTGAAYETYDDKPRWAYWADARRQRIRIVTIYCREGEVWYRSVFTLAGELEPYAPSPYLDEDGKPDCALIMQSAYVDRDNDRYGLVRDYMTLQDEVNKRRSKFLHLANNRQVRVSNSVGMDAKSVRKELSRPDGVVVAEQGEVEIISTGDMAAGHFNLLAEAKQAINSVGPNATMQGKAGQDQSGRAIMALQQGGMTEMAPLLDGLRDFNIRLFRAIWCRVRQLWTAERWVRVTDEEKNARFVGLNITKGQSAMMKLGEAYKAGQVDQPTAMQYAQQLQADPSMMEPMNAVAEMDVDIQIDEVQNAPTLQIEQFEQLAKLAPMAPPQYVPTLFEMMVEASNLRNKDKLREILQAAQQQGPSPADQLQLAAGQADVEKTQSETARNMADAQATLAGIEVDAMAAGQQVAMAA